MRSAEARSISRLVILLLAGSLTLSSGIAVATPQAAIQLERAGDITTWPLTEYRNRDLAQNAYAPSYQDAYAYDDANVTVTFTESGAATFTGHISATDLKPNFAYQIKLAGKPTGLYGGEGDDATNERLGYAGRWWEVAPNPGNRDDAYYEVHQDDPDYIFEGYLIFDFFHTDRFGAAELDFALDSSYHVLWWDWQRNQGPCDEPLRSTTVTGAATDLAYNHDLTPTGVGVYPEIERLCYGETTLPGGEVYNCRFVLTEESFHQNGGPATPDWVGRSGLRLQKDGGDYYYAGTNCYYLMTFAADPAQRPEVDEVLNESKALGLNAVRTWAFSDGGTGALQTSPGVYDENVFVGLDYVVAKAGELGLQLILPLVNNWDDYGGMNQYVAWSAGGGPPSDGFVSVSGTRFEIDGSPYYFTGTNLWYGLNLASAGPGGDRARLNRELDRLVALGITCLTVMTGTEGPDTEPWRVVPSLQTAPGVYDAAVLDGLDYLLAALGTRGLRCVMCLSNFWPWSGGLAQYVSWYGGGAIPYPPPEPGGDWNVYGNYTSTFYGNAGATMAYLAHFDYLATHTNPYTGLAYRDDPTIAAWELVNELRGYDGQGAAMDTWIDAAAAHIKSVDPNHLVCTGTEGDTPWPVWHGLNFESNNNGPDIDFATIHIWPQNWNWYDPTNPEGTYASAEALARSYFTDHATRANTLGKPIMLQEFGLARDGGSFDPTSTTVWRDQFNTAMYDEVYASASGGGPAVGSMFWAWAGEGRPLVPYGSYWQEGDPWIGDPPHEQQGWYSVYESDSGTAAVITSHAAQMTALNTTPLTHDDFYTDPDCRQWYRDHASAMVNRVNTFTGVAYKDDPTIMAWELANEPRCESDPSGDTLQGWIEEMAAFLKSTDAQHLVTTGSEGFFGPGGGHTDLNPQSWMSSAGVDFVRNHAPAAIDLVCLHVWPDQWGLSWQDAMDWVSDHVTVSTSEIGKPVILEEFGKNATQRDLFYQGWYDEIYNAAADGAAAAGSHFWILYHDTHSDYDGYGVYYPADATTVTIIQAEARRIRDLSTPVPTEGSWAAAMTYDDLQFTLAGDADPPGPVTGLNAEPGHERVTVTWTSPEDPDLATFHVYRGLWHDGDGITVYPEYDDAAGNTIPARPADRAAAESSGEWVLAGTVPPDEQSFIDYPGSDLLLRGVYFYEVFAEDLGGNFSPPSAANTRATNYWLGDVDGDGLINIGGDVNVLSLTYGLDEGETGFNAYCDVGPTDDWSGTGIPVTDNHVNFEDLMIFALNWDINVAKTLPTEGSLIAGFSWVRIDNTTWALVLDEPCLNLKGVNLQAEMPQNTVLSLTAGSLLGQQDSPYFLRNIPHNGLNAGLALLGNGACITGRGELIRVKLTGDFDLDEILITARDSDNKDLEYTLEESTADPGIPTWYALSANYPNPFNPSTKIDFDLPESQNVQLVIFGVDGRRIATLKNESMSAGRHTVTWTGRNDQDELVATGIYFYRIQAGDFSETKKMTLVK